MKKFRIPILILLATAALGWAGWSYLNPSHCQVCDREGCRIMQYGLKSKWGLPIKTCCPQCGLTYLHHHPKAKADFATDFESGKRVDAATAFYVRGSDVILCHQPESVRDELHGEIAYTKYDRCLPSMIAFKNLEDAERFQKNHGGRVLRFAELGRT